MVSKVLTFITVHTEPHTIRVISPVGVLAVACVADKIVSLDIKSRSNTRNQHSDSTTKQISMALNAYFINSKYHFRLPLQLHGTPFQQRVWQALQTIPPGQTRTYGDLAKQLRSSPRAVGMACRANPVPVIVPCHRVIAANGLGGYAGKTAGRQIAIKRWLLQHEGVRFE